MKGKDYIYLDNQYYEDIKKAKYENYEKIYFNEKIERKYDDVIEPMFWEIYEKLYGDLISGNEESVIFRHHMNFVRENEKYYDKDFTYQNEEPAQIVADYIASMTDDYFIDLYSYLFPNGKFTGEKNGIKYIGYFEQDCK